jgi:SsrA-binding protein
MPKLYDVAPQDAHAKKRAAGAGKPRERKVIAKNRRAHYEYAMEETFEAGLVLKGTEVRSLRERSSQLTDAFCLIRGGEAWLHGMHIAPFSHGNIANVDSDRRRKLLLHKNQLRYLDAKLRQKGMALIPLELYFDEHNRVKVLIALAKGKKAYDKRDTQAKRDSDRELARAVKAFNQKS